MIFEVQEEVPAGRVLLGCPHARFGMNEGSGDFKDASAPTWLLLLFDLGSKASTCGKGYGQFLRTSFIEPLPSSLFFSSGSGGFCVGLKHHPPS
jgi:hypothetical protein